MALLLKEQPLECESPEEVLVVGSLVYVTCYGPCWGLRGIICKVDVIAPANVPFYLVALQEGPTKEPLWFVHDHIAVAEGENVSLWRPSRKERSQVELEAISIVIREAERMQGGKQETLSTV